MKNFAKTFQFDVIDVLLTKEYEPSDKEYRLVYKLVWPDLSSSCEYSISFDDIKALDEEFDLVTHEHVLQVLGPIFQQIRMEPVPVKPIGKLVSMEFLFEFKDYRAWAFNAQQYFGELPPYTKAITLDTKGNCLISGKDFRIAQERGTYPVKTYRLILVSDIDNTTTTES